MAAAAAALSRASARVMAGASGVDDRGQAPGCQHETEAPCVDFGRVTLPDLQATRRLSTVPLVPDLDQNAGYHGAVVSLA